MIFRLIFLCDLKDDEISSRDLPFVSGITNIANKTFIIQKTANIDQTHSTPYFNVKDGYTLHVPNHKRYPIVCTIPFITPVNNKKLCFN